MTLRKFAITIALLLAVGLVVGCGDDAPPQVPGMQPPLPALPPTPPPIPPPVAMPAQAPELSAAEQQTLKAQYTAEAAAEINDGNAEAMAAALEQEIDAEVATEQ
jgi:hypothetical protein